MAFVNRLVGLLAGALLAAQALGAVNVAVTSSAMPATTTTQDLTNANIDTLDAAIIFFSRGITNNTIAEEGGISIGFVDGAGDDRGISAHEKDAQGTASDVQQENSTTNAANMADAASGSSIAEAAGSAVTDGLRLTWSDINSQELIGAFLTGNDGAADATTLTLNNTTPVTVTHGLGATADLIVAISMTTTTTGNASFNPMSFGFYDVGGNTYRSVSSRHLHNGATTQTAGTYNNDALIVDHDNASIAYKVTVSNCDSDSCDFVASNTTTDVVFLMFYDFPAGVDIQVGDFTTRTTNGTNADISGMTDAPTAVLYGTTFMPTGSAANTVESDANEGEGIGFGAAVNNGGTALASTAMYGNDAVALGTSDTKSLFSQDKIVALNGSGALGYAFGISSWDSGGVTHNYTTTDGTARRVIYAAIGPQAGSAPTFETGIAETADTIDSATFSYDPSADADTLWCGLYRRAAADPTAAEVKAGTNAHGDATEAAELAGGSMAVTTDDADPQAAYDAHCALENEIGLSALSSLDKVVLEPPTDDTYFETDAAPGGSEISLFDGEATVNDDYAHATLVVDCFVHGEGAHTATYNADGTYTIDTALGHPTTLLTLEWRFQDVSAGAWSNASKVLYGINNQPPSWVGLDSILFPDDWLLPVGESNEFPLDDLWSHPYARPLSHNITNLPSGFTEDGETLTVLPDTCGVFATPEFEASDDLGLSEQETVTITVGARVPDVVDGSEAAAIAAIEALCSLTATAGTPQYSETVALGNVISTDPAADEVVVPDQDVTYVVSLGVNPVEPAAERKVVYVLASVDSLVRWVDYIPVGEVPGCVSGRYDNDGCWAVDVISSTTGLTAWVDYTPVGVVDEVAAGKWRYENDGWIPVDTLTP